jgi:ribonuclease P protein component
LNPYINLTPPPRKSKLNPVKVRWRLSRRNGLSPLRGKEKPPREENIPALQDQAVPNAWLFCENVVQLRPEGLGQAAEKGPKAPDRLRRRASLPVAAEMTQKTVGRLRHRDFDRVCSQPPTDRTRGYRLYAARTPADREPGGRARLGLSVSRRVGKAVLRNLVRRRLRAALRASAGLAAGVDVIIVARPGIERFPFEALCRQLERSLRRASKGGPGGEIPEEDQNATDQESPGDTGAALPGPAVSSSAANL